MPPPRSPPVPGLDTIGALTNETVFALDRRPDRLAVVGGGAIGCELAQAFARLGTHVTVIEAAERLLPLEDPDASAVIEAALDRRWRRRPGRRPPRAGRPPTARTVASTSLMAPTSLRTRCWWRRGDDRSPLDSVSTGVGVEVDAAGRIVVDDTCATNIAGVWAIGDVTPFGGFTHVAGHMGFVAATNATRTNRFRPAAKVDRRVVPRVTFTDPEVASVGVTEADAAAVGGRVAVVRFDHVDRAITSGREAGFVKLIAGPRPLLRSVGGGQVLGATIVGPRAGEMIGEIALAMRTKMFTGRLAQTIHAYPTWSMAIQQAATGFFFDTEGVEVRPAEAARQEPAAQCRVRSAHQRRGERSTTPATKSTRSR